MSTPRYEECLRKELETNTSLTNEERLEILRYLAKIETVKLLNVRARIKKSLPVKPIKQRDKLVELPPPPPSAEPAVPMGKQVENILAEMKEAEKQENGNGEEVHTESDQASGAGEERS
ncbi:MAG: hypothetical protein ACYDHE_21100 [Candidatus Acidiferrales bacterium]